MSATQDLENRLALLEEEVRHLRMQVRMQVTREQEAVSGKTSPDFPERFAGIFADDPTFDEAVRLGREWRDGDKPQENHALGVTESSL